MNTYKEIVYLVLDELKLTSDDAKFTEDHIMFLMDKYRPFLLKQRYSDIKKSIPESNYQTACLDLIQVPAISGEPCEGGCYLRSREKVPFIMHIGIPRVYPKDYFQGEISYISRDRMRYVGHNKYLQNIIYATLGPDNYLYLKSSNPQYVHLESVRFTAVFLDAKDAYKMARDAELDLVKIAPTAKPPVCKIIDYGKYKYEMIRREKEAKKKQKVIEVKEVRLSPNIDTNDLNTKVGSARKFIEKGNKVKVTLRFRGREMAHMNQTRYILDDFAEKLADIAVVDKPSKVEGRSLVMFLTAKR